MWFMSKKVFSQLIHWSKNQYSHLPWRRERTLYGTLVSEIMLQQTTVGTVLNHYENFLNEYPTLLDLAQASEEQVCVSWKGLGYYRRARNLRNLAIQILNQYKGTIPTDQELLLKLKGIGPYTANAIVAIGADKKGLAVDANLERVLARFYGESEVKGVKLQQKLLKDFSDKKILIEMDSLSPREINEAFMDLGRILCQAKKASCSLCPLRENCVAFRQGTPLAYPKEERKKVKEDFYLKLLRVVVKKNNEILFYQKQENEWLSGQWELPSFIIETNDKCLEQYPKLKMKKAHFLGKTFKTSITKYKIENFIYEMSENDFMEMVLDNDVHYQFYPLSKNLNASTASLKAMKILALG